MGTPAVPIPATKHNGGVNVTTAAIPTTFDALTPEWLTRALREGGKAGDVTVRAVSYEPVGLGVGILCLLARLSLEYEGDAGDAPRTVIAKIPSSDPQTRGMVSIFRFYEREVRFYRDLAAEVPVCTPICYYGEFDAASGDFVLLLEDLAASRIGDQCDGASAEDAEKIVRNVARLHAAFWESPTLNALDWMPTAADPLNKAGVALYPQAWPIFMERVGHALPAEMQRVGERLGTQVGDILDRFVAGPRTICHGDVRLDNIFFPEGSDEVALIDWQIGIRATGTYDIAYFMSQSVDVDLRRAHEMDLLHLYHSLLTEGGVTGYSFEQTLEDYRWGVLFCLAYPVMGGGFGDLSNERGYRLATAMMNRSAAAIMDWKAGELLEG
jgi:hypothetical protein